MLPLIGPEGLPAFRRERLALELGRRLERPVGLSARSLYLLDTQALPAGQSGERLLRLIDASPFDPQPHESRLAVVPRPGTQSGWSSKASDILARCGFADIRRIERGLWLEFEGLDCDQLDDGARELIHDRMTQVLVDDPRELSAWFGAAEPQPLRHIALGAQPLHALAEANEQLGLALNHGEMTYLADTYRALGRDPTDTELMMFAQVNSEHCRHKIFNATWTVDGRDLEDSLFGLIRQTHARNPDGVITAYDDNAAIIEGFPGILLAPGPGRPDWGERPAEIHIQIKVETHNHPTAISPDPGAATGSGGEIRDESATGRGGRPVAGLTGFTVSDLRIPGFEQPWEKAPPPPRRLADACRIMREGPIGAARFNNEFGRPALGGYFRTFSQFVGESLWGYHKPIMIAGGAGMILGGQVQKLGLRPGYKVIVLGGPAMLIGLGGGAASSMGAGQSTAELDFASVQRANPEMQRRCQEVIDACWAAGADNPIASIHDVGAGGLSNAIPELLDGGGVGGHLELRKIPTADPGLSPMELWCNEAQERYVLAVAPENLPAFEALCERERCPHAVLGEATGDGRLRVEDRRHADPPVDLALDVVLGKPPGLHRDARSERIEPAGPALDGITLDEAVDRVLRVPSVGSKQFLITIGDRTVGGLSVRDQMVGPWQVPVADCAVTLTDYRGYSGTVMAMGERTPLAIWDAPASGRMAVAEALTNLIGTKVPGLSRIKLSANWMAAAGEPGQDAALRATVEAVARDFCAQLDLAIPVGKDSLSMQTRWRDGDSEQHMRAPVSLIVTAFSPVADVRRSLNPQLAADPSATALILVDLGRGRLGGSALAQAFGRQPGPVPDVEEPSRLRALFECIQALITEEKPLAVHDRSDGGLFATLLEMALAGHTGIEVDVPADCELLPWLFAEEIGVVMQVRNDDLEAVGSRLEQSGLGGCVHPAGAPAGHDRMVIRRGGEAVFEQPMAALARAWGETSYRMQRLRDHPQCADEEFAALSDWQRPGLKTKLSFEPRQVPGVAGKSRPRVAILREQGVNGQREMAMAFLLAGFDAVDVHMSDLESGRARLDEFRGFAACGGFSFGDVLGAGQGWARSILFNQALRDQFEAFLARPDRFALGVCNGCQMLSALKEIIPGTAGWPRFVHNRSRQFEARLNLVEIGQSPSIFLSGMAGSRLPVATAHGEGRAEFDGAQPVEDLVAVRYVTGEGKPAEQYPDNPNGSPSGITGLSNADGRVTILMPHPERLLRTVNFSWAPPEWGEESPWMRMFQNARAWCDQV